MPNINKVFALLIIAIFSPPQPLLSSQAIPDHLAVRALVVEAGGQQDEELCAHANALRNRGTLRGVYGLHAKHLSTEPQWVFDRARRAWDRAKTGPDVVGGRTEWRSDYDLKLMARRGETPKSCGLYDGLRVGNTIFYRITHAKRNSSRR